MKTRATILISLITLQLLFLGWLHYCAAAELAAAPHIIVQAASPRGHDISPVQDIPRHPGCGCRVQYSLDAYSLKAYRTARRKFGESKLQLTLEIAMRERRPRMATNLFVNGVPIAEAVPLMSRGELPQTAD